MITHSTDHPFNKSIHCSFLTSVSSSWQETVGDQKFITMTFREILVPNQENVDPRAMLPLPPVREQLHQNVRQHAGLGHGHDDQEMNLEDMLPLRQAFHLDQDDEMLEDHNNQLRTGYEPREHGRQQRVNAVQDRPQAFAPGPANVVAGRQRQEDRQYHDGGNVLGVTRVISTCCFLHAANVSWLTISHMLNVVCLCDTLRLSYDPFDA